jgi:hypothetical protein
MACTYVFDRNERMYLQVEGSAAWGTVLNTSGTATVAGSNYCRHISLELNPNQTIATRRDKTGTRSIPQGTASREDGNWKCQLSLAGNGAAGVKPDADPFLQAIFGKAPTIVATTSVTYSLADSIPSLDIWSFRTDSLGTGNPNQRVGVGSIVETATWSMSADQEIAEWSLEGVSKLVLDSFGFAARTTAGDTEGKSGLTAFPAEPGSPVSNGNAAQGFYGSLTLDSQVLTTIKSATIKVETGNKFSKVFGSKFPGCPIGAVRKVTFACDLYDGSDAATKDIYARAFDKNPITGTVVLGNQPGNTHTFTITGLQLAPYTYDESDDTYALKFADSMATSNAGLTELTYAIT